MEEELNRMRILNHGEKAAVFVTVEEVAFAGMAFTKLIREGIDPTIADMTLFRESDREEYLRILQTHDILVLYAAEEEQPWMKELEGYPVIRVAAGEDLAAAVEEAVKGRMRS